MVCNQQHSFEKFRDISNFKEIPLDPMHTKLDEFHKKFEGLKNITPKIEPNISLQVKFLGNAGDLFNELYYIYKEKYEEKQMI